MHNSFTSLVYIIIHSHDDLVIKLLIHAWLKTKMEMEMKTKRNETWRKNSNMSAGWRFDRVASHARSICIRRS